MHWAKAGCTGSGFRYGWPASRGAAPAAPDFKSRWLHRRYLCSSSRCSFICELATGGGLELLAALPLLRKLELCGCDLRAVPPALSGLASLEELYLNYNEELAGGCGLEHLAALMRLRTLHLTECGLRTVPPAFSCLTALEDLDLSDNHEMSEAGTGLKHLLALPALRCVALPRHLSALVPGLRELMIGVQFCLNRNKVV